MKRSRFSEHQIIAILKAVEAGRTVKDVCREHEISEDPFGACPDTTQTVSSYFSRVEG
jgi:putative transposase